MYAATYFFHILPTDICGWPLNQFFHHFFTTIFNCIKQSFGIFRHASVDAHLAERNEIFFPALWRGVFFCRSACCSSVIVGFVYHRIHLPRETTENCRIQKSLALDDRRFLVHHSVANLKNSGQCHPPNERSRNRQRRANLLPVHQLFKKIRFLSDVLVPTAWAEIFRYIHDASWSDCI